MCFVKFNKMHLYALKIHNYLYKASNSLNYCNYLFLNKKLNEKECNYLF